MQRGERNTITYVDYLSDKDKLTVRLVNKACRDAVKHRQSAPYHTRAQFICALTGIFLFDLSDLSRTNPDTSLSLTLNIFKIWAFELRLNGYSLSVIEKPASRSVENVTLTDSWKLYLQTLSSASHQPAMLYKLKHRHYILGSNTHEKFRLGENIIETARLYAPLKHTWVVNQTWVLAQIHKARRFVLFSPVTANTVLRQPHHQRGSRQFSAFALEIAAIIKSGYEISRNQYHRIELSPKADVNLLAVTYDDLTVTDYEVMHAIGQIQGIMTPTDEDILSQSPPSI